MCKYAASVALKEGLDVTCYARMVVTLTGKPSPAGYTEPMLAWFGLPTSVSSSTPFKEERGGTGRDDETEPQPQYPPSFLPQLGVAWPLAVKKQLRKDRPDCHERAQTEPLLPQDALSDAVSPRVFLQ
jgi:hypothetical protein